MYLVILLMVTGFCGNTLAHWRSTREMAARYDHTGSLAASSFTITTKITKCVYTFFSLNIFWCHIFIVLSMCIDMFAMHTDTNIRNKK